MRIVRMSLCTGLLVVCGLMASAAERAQKPQRSQTQASVSEASTDLVPVNDALAAIAAASSACEVIGASANPDQFVTTTPNQFRGDVFSMTKQVVLIEIQMELEFVATVGTPQELFFYVFEESTGDPATFDVIFESTINGTGDGQPTFYASGPVELSGGAPLTLEAGKRYAIGAAWASLSGSPSRITYFGDGLNYPRPFVAGQVDGVVAFDAPLPLTSLGTPFVFASSGAFSLQLCLSGACCDGATCSDVSQGQCSFLGGEFTAAGITCTDDLPFVPCPLVQGACCLGGQGCFNLNEFACEVGGGAWNEGVACDDASDPCAPRGACCRTGPGPAPDLGPSCVPNVTENRCALLRGTYRGDDVACDVAPGCGAGACCSAEACAELTEAACAAQPTGTVFAGLGVSCESDPCVPTGACCNGQTCSDVTEEDCGLIFGASFRGDGTSCASLSTPCGRGACCLAGVGCADLTESFCEIQGGVFRADGTTCATLSPRCEGACCWGSGGALCAAQTTPEQCVDKLGGSFAGYDVSCSEPPTCTGGGANDGAVCALDADCDSGTCTAPVSPCPVTSPSACCLSVDACVEADKTTCETSLSGRFVGACRFGGAFCNSNLDCLICQGGGEPPRTVCTDNTGCTSGGTCTRTTLCRTDQSCTADLCATTAPEGACCDGTDCTDVIEADCSLISGAVFRGDGTDCGSLSPACGPVGACCDGTSCEGDGDIQSACTAGSPTWVEGAVCDPFLDPCAQVGACCNADPFECFEEVVEAACTGADGAWTAAMVCSAITCTATPTGACCEGAVCSVITQAACQSSGGQYRGDGQVCAANNCGACCQLNGTCEDDAALAGCTEPNAVYYAAFSCVDSCFARGSCCVGDLCVDGLTRLGCEGETGSDGVYGGDNSVCATGHCTIGACCRTDESCVEFSRKECELDGGAYLGAGSTCSIANAQVCARGTCCASDGTCISNAIILDCAEAPDFSTDAVFCFFADCVGRGACCLDDGTCAIREQLTCLAKGGAYRGDATSCGPGFCEVGACCSGGACTIETAAACTGLSGTYGGDNSTCDPGDLCVDGACCDSGVCSNNVTRQDCGGTYGGAASTCTGTGECEVGACCDQTGSCVDKALRLSCDSVVDEFTLGQTCDSITTCEARGACCSSLDVLSFNSTRVDCELAGGRYLGDASDGVGVTCGMGACCSTTTGCALITDPLTECVAADKNYLGDDTACNPSSGAVDCTNGACCDPLEFCTLEAFGDCTQPKGQFFGGTTCDSRVCDITVLSSRPSQGAIDARQPYDPDGTEASGWESIDINFTGNPALLTPADFLVELVPGGETPPSVVDVVAVGTNVALQFDGPIPRNQWTRIRHLTSDTVTWIGTLPGDVNADRVVNSLDIAAIVDCISDPGSCELWQCDIDRSNTCAPADVLRVIDIINGIGAYAGLSAGSLPQLP